MRRRPFILLLLAACGSDQVLEHDLDPIQLARAPVEPGGATTGGLLAAVSTVAGIEPGESLESAVGRIVSRSGIYIATPATASGISRKVVVSAR